MPKNGPIKPNYCLKLLPFNKEESGRFEISEQWSLSNCYLFYSKSFESQIEAKEFCRTAFGEKYIGELVYGLGIYPRMLYRQQFEGMPHERGSHHTNNYNYYIQWKYMKLDILDRIDNFTCRCTPKPVTKALTLNDIEYIGLKKDNECPRPSLNMIHGYMFARKLCSTTIYNIPTVCAMAGKMFENE